MLGTALLLPNRSGNVLGHAVSSSLSQAGGELLALSDAVLGGAGHSLRKANNVPGALSRQGVRAAGDGMAGFAGMCSPFFKGDSHMVQKSLLPLGFFWPGTCQNDTPMCLQGFPLC